MATVLDYLNALPEVLLLEKANALNTGDIYEVGVTDVVFGIPSAVIASTHDTEVVVTSAVDSAFVNPQTLKYSRFDLSVLALIGPTTIALNDGATLADIVAELNLRFGFLLQTSDLDESAITLGNPFTDGDDLVLTATPTSLLYQGTVTLQAVHNTVLLSENDFGA